MKQNNRFKDNKGFSLVESVVTLIAVTIVTGLFLMLVDFAKNTYITMQESSQGQILCSNLTNAIQDELRYASLVELDSSDSKCNFTYYSQSVGKGETCKIISGVKDSKSNDPNTNKIMNLTSYKVKYPTSDKKAKLYIEYYDGSTYEYYDLVGNDTYIFNLQADIDCKYDKSTKRFHCVITISDSKSSSQIIQSDFYVYPLNKGSL